MKIHLVTYATPRFRMRQLLLGWSARWNHVADTITHWTPEKLLKAGFEEGCKDIKLNERGSGFWAWKPFIIDAKICEAADGDIVFYCDVGRKYPFILLNHSLNCYVNWMVKNSQDIMPGVMIPWNGSMEIWTKADAFTEFNMDQDFLKSSSPIQASFSLWRVSNASKMLAAEWRSVCSQRKLISDDPSQSVEREAPLFRGHRHDQSLLSLCCMKYGIQGINIGRHEPDYNEKDPGMVAQHHFGEAPTVTLLGHIIATAGSMLEFIEVIVRKKIKLGKTND